MRHETNTSSSPSDIWIDGYCDANSDRAPQNPSSAEYMAGYTSGKDDLEMYGE